jgi:hypothetical protein
MNPPPPSAPAEPAAASPQAAQRQRVRAAFDALEPLAAAERESGLGALAAAPDGAALAAEVRGLLAAAAAAADGFLAPWPPAVEPLAVGERLGPWRVVQRLGAGGMGEVWRAERADGAYDGQAAIKVLHGAYAAAAATARFAAERRALARLEHPHIARLLDAGQTAGGQPYLVMEHVAGVPLDTAASALPLRGRIALFLQLCDAVAHAHRQLLLHRDLKPANVLVTAGGQVKLLDFGIAKTLDDPDSGLTQGALLFTPRWASPEQLRGEPVGTASDVYSLGVILHGLLTGQPPYGRNAQGPHALGQAVLHEEPTRPSRTPQPDAAAVPAQLLRGDLDTIVLKALAKQPEQRYASVDALADDLRAWRDGYPIAARPAPWALQLQRFVGRNRWASGFALLAALALVGGLLAAQWQMRRAEQALAVAERRLDEGRALTRQIVFRYHDQIRHLPGAVAVRSALLDDAAAYLDGLGRDAAGDPELARELAETYHRLSVLQGESFSPGQERLQAALAATDKATAWQSAYLGPHSPVEQLHAAVDMWLHRASVEARLGRLEASIASLEQARARIVQAAGRGAGDVQLLSRLATLEGRIALNLGSNLAQANLGRVDEARRHWDTAVQLFEQIVAREPQAAEWVHQLAWGWVGRTGWAILDGQVEEAIAAGRRAVALRDEAAAMAPGNAHFAHQRALVRNNLATALSLGGQHREGLALQREALALIRATIAADASNRTAGRDLVLVSLSQARPLLALGERAAARAAIAFALDALPAEAVGTDDFYLARWRAEALVWWARLRRTEAPAEAARAARDAIAQIEVLQGADHAARRWARGQARAELALAQQAGGDGAGARATAAAALQDWGSRVPGYFAPQHAAMLALVQPAPARP